MKAYALASLKIGKKTFKASTDDEPVIVDLTDKEFKRLAAMNAVRVPTKNEIKLAAVEDAEVVEETPAAKLNAPKGGKPAESKASTGTDTQAGGAGPDLNI